VFKHIVVGCDGSPEGRDAVALGAAIASVTGARLSLVGVFPTSLFPVTGVTDRKTRRFEATRWLRRDRDQLAPGAFIRPVADSSVPRALRHYAEQWHSDLVVIGSSRSAAPGHVSIGRRGRQLLYDAPFALGLADRGLHERGPQLQTVGVGEDGGPEAQAALALGAQLARAAGSRLLVRRVVEDRAPALTAEQWIALEDWDHNEVWADARQTALAEARAGCSNLGVHADVSATVGDPGYELRAFSDTVDLVVVGSRRWGPVARLVSGGVGETLVTDASCSILIVPRPAVSHGRRADQRHRRRPIAA
jgi:nucleotide-binding universal stress UspA family protein